MSEKFGKYLLEQKLAVGGMAEVFLATHQGPEGFQKHVAIKRVLPHLSEDSDFVTMFLDEARLVARFNHPNIVQIFELGEEKRRYFLAMEFINGKSMSKVLKACRKSQTPLPLEYGAKIVSAACEGLEYAHTFADADGTLLNLIHRDVSPQNLMLSYDGVVKVLDFGIAKAAGNIYQTRTSSLKGKAAYMSPEQISQKMGLDRRSDIFSLGIVLYEFVVGRRPFGGDTELELMMSIVKKKPPDPRKFNDTIPDDLVDILSKALANNREDRFQSCREMRQALEEFLINRRMLVDAYTLGSFLRELIPPGDTGVGYSMQTPSHPSQIGLDEPVTSDSRPRPRNSGEQNPPAPIAGDGQDAATQLTPSSQLRPLIDQVQDLVDAPSASDSAGESLPLDTNSLPEQGGGGRLVFGVVILLLVGVIGASVAFLVFGDGSPTETGDAGLAGVGPVAGPGSDGASGYSDAGAENSDGGKVGQPSVLPLDGGEGRAADPVILASADGSKTDPALEHAPPVKTVTPKRKKRKKRKRRRVATAVPVKEAKAKEATRVAKVDSRGKVVVDTRPWTNVTIDGTAYGTTPVGPVELKAGLHKIVLRNKANGIKLAKSIRILAGQTHRVQEKFGQGRVQVFVKPFGQVFINGVSKGMTPLSGPIKLYEGTHQVKVVCDRTGKSESKRVRIKGGQTTKLIFDLR